MKLFRLLAAVVTVMTTPALAEGYQAPSVRLLDDPFGRDAPPPATGPAPDVRADPIPAYQRFPPHWRMQQQRDVCRPDFDRQTGHQVGWTCRMPDGSVQEIR